MQHEADSHLFLPNVSFAIYDFDVCKSKRGKQFLVFSENESNGFFRRIIIQSVYFCWSQIVRNSLPINFL